MATKKFEHRKQYFVAIIPPSPVFEEVLALKEYFKAIYGSKAALNSPPHITLHMPFLWNEVKEGKLVAKIEDFSMRHDPIKVCLDNFSSFPPRVIFINVTESDVLEELQRNQVNRQTVENPVTRVLREGIVVGLAAPEVGKALKRARGAGRDVGPDDAQARYAGLMRWSVLRRIVGAPTVENDIAHDEHPKVAEFFD